VIESESGSHEYVMQLFTKDTNTFAFVCSNCVSTPSAKVGHAYLNTIVLDLRNLLTTNVISLIAADISSGLITLSEFAINISLPILFIYDKEYNS
jgi:hypothetical protein